MGFASAIERRRIPPSGPSRRLKFSRYAAVTRPLHDSVHQSSSLRRAYTLWAPFYDAVVTSTFVHSRRQSLAGLGDVAGKRVLLVGIGTGLDIPWLKPGATYVGIDVTSAMLSRAHAKALAYEVPMRLARGDGMALPFRDRTFDRIVLHLILAVVPDQRALLNEAARVLRPGGTIHILDKFLRPGQRAPIRRWISPLLGRLATRTDVVFEDIVASCPGLEVLSDEPDRAAGWFRRIVLRRPR